MSDLQMLDSMIIERRNKVSGSYVLTRKDLNRLDLNLKEDFEELIEEYIRENPGLNLVYHYDQVQDHQVISWWWG